MRQRISILQAARTLREPFTVEELTVAAWQAAPAAFGLREYALPDKRRVLRMLHRLVRRGSLCRTANGRYRLTWHGCWELGEESITEDRCPIYCKRRARPAKFGACWLANAARLISRPPMNPPSS